MMVLRSTKEAVMFSGFHTMGAGGWVLMSVFWVALVALVVWVLVRLLPTRADDHQAKDETSDTPREVLDRRLAGGEIDVQTYEQLREKLGPRPLAGRR
jgi:putative membrane protein